MHARSTELPEEMEGTSRQRWLEVLLVLTIFFVVGGAPAPHVNEAHYLAKAKHYWDPEWCAGDLFLESADAHLTFYWTVGVLTKWFSLPTVAWVGRFVAWAFLAWSWQRLSERVIRLRYASVLTAMLLVWLVERANFAGEWVIGGIEGKCLAYGFALWALSELIVGRWNRAWPLLGLASAFHVLVGGWSVVAAGLVWLFTTWKSNMARNMGIGQSVAPAPPRFGPMFPSLLLGGLLSLAGVIPSLQLFADVPPEVAAEANQIYVFHRLPHHLAPLTLPPAELYFKSYRFGMLVLALALLGKYFQMANASSPDERDQPVPSPAPCVTAESALRLQLLLRFAWASMVIFLCGLLWEIATWNHPALAASILKYYWFRLADIAVPVAVSLAVVLLIADLVARGSRLSAWVGVLAIALPAWFVITTSTDRWYNNAPPSDMRMRNPAAWQETCEWVRDHTPEDALFLVPRTSQTFKWHASRADLCTWKDVPQDAESLVAWWQRYRDVFTYVDPWGEQAPYGSLGEIGTRRIHDLAETYEFDYVVAGEYPPLQLPVVFANAGYNVYRLNSPSVPKSISPAPESNDD